MLYLITMGDDQKSQSVKNIDEAPEELATGQVVYDSGEEPVDIMRFMENSDGDIVPMTAEDRDAEIAAMAIPAAAQRNRRLRDQLLLDSDWTQVVDTPLSDTAKDAWATYRTALRDMPDHTEWPMVDENDWPTAP